MPELLEVEAYRLLAETVVGCRIEHVETPDEWFLKGVTALEVTDALTGATVAGTRRIGKLLTVSVGETRPLLGLRFGMTGRLLLDDDGPIDRLEYAPGRDDTAWDRFALVLDDRRRLRVTDPRRLGGVELDPDVRRLGPDAASVTAAQLQRALAGSSSPLKARLLDQSRLAGLGNLLVDESLWRAGLRPDRPAGGLRSNEVDHLAETVRSTVAVLGSRGGSNQGDLHPQRHRDGTCPSDATPLRRQTIGGRTTYWCPHHQR